MLLIPQKIKNYDNASVRIRFSEYYDIPQDDAAKIFENLKLFLYISHQYLIETGKRLRIVDETFVIDEMWHNFILFTEDYQGFCQEMFGEFYHHTPTISRDETITIAELSEQLNFIEKYIGEETLQLWYSTWAKKYNAKEMHKRQILPDIEFEALGAD